MGHARCRDREGANTSFSEIVCLLEPGIANLQGEPAWPARRAAAQTILREFTDAGASFDPSRSRDLGGPTLRLQGEESPANLTAATQAVHGTLPRSRIGLMPGQGPVAMSTAPDLFARLATVFSGEPS